MLWAILVALSLVSPAVTGVVKDSTGSAVAGATVVIRTSGGAEQRTVSGPDGPFSFANPPEGAATLIVRAGGFAEATKPITGATQQIEVELALPTMSDAVTVTPTRSELPVTDVPA